MTNSFMCPRCDTHNTPANPAAHARLLALGACQGCRASDAIRKRPELAGIFISYWGKHKFPASPSWLASVEAAG